MMRGKNISINDIMSIADLIVEGILVMEPDSTIVFINNQHALHEFFSSEELIGRKFNDLVAEGYYTYLTPISIDEIATRLENEKILNFEGMSKSKRRMLVSVAPIRNQEGKVSLIVATSRDITEIERMRRELESEAMLRKFYEQQLQKSAENQEFIFKSPEMKEILATALKVSQVDSPVFLTGESGVGKGLVARKIHEFGARKDYPFVQVNCAAIPENLFEAEIFGYNEGAFTGASKQGKPGLMEVAASGTLFLDEIGELPISLQAKMLQVLQEGEFRRVGATQSIKLKARIITATNRNVEKLIADGMFREDLYYRLCVVPIHIPSLKERPEDIIILAEMFLQRFNLKYGECKVLSPGVKEWMFAYSWPGNVREVQNMIERLAITSNGKSIELNDIPRSQRNKVPGYEEETQRLSLKEKNKELEKRLLKSVVSSGKSSRQAAKELGISQTTFLRKIRQYGIVR